jgi:hypothetical protein
MTARIVQARACVRLALEDDRVPRKTGGFQSTERGYAGWHR